MFAQTISSNPLAADPERCWHLDTDQTINPKGRVVVIQESTSI